MHKHTLVNTSRQASLPAPNPGLAAGSFPGFQTGRVTYVDHDARTVDVYLDSGEMLADVPVLCRSSGPDRSDDDLPAPRTQVGIMYAWGHKFSPYVIGAIPRAGKTLKKGLPGVGAVRRVFANGGHWMMHDKGSFEARFADGSSLVIGDMSDPTENHTSQQRESRKANPFTDPPLEGGGAAGAFKLTLKMKDGATFTFSGGSWNVSIPSNVSIQAGGVLTLQGASIVIAGGSVAIN